MAKKTGELTPLMKQYWDVKTLHQDKIVLFRMGDFYELFYDDAIKASPLLGITLTQRNKKSEDQTPMCGFPHHSVAGHINKLLSSGLKVAICDQVEDPALAKGLVKRAITRILTPGMIYDSETLDQTKAHYLSALDHQSISFIDTTTGEAFYYLTQQLEDKLRLLDLLPVAELVHSFNDESQFPDWLLALKKSEKFVLSFFSDTQDESSHQLLLSYIQSLTQQNLLQSLRPFEQREFEHRLHLSANTLRHLEIFSTNKGDHQGSLFSAINRTKTSGGARLLRQWISFPLRNLKQIENRYSQIHEFREHMFELKKVRESLSGMGDIERRLGKIAQPQCHARDLLGLAEALKAGISALNWCETFYKTKKDIQIQSGLIAENIFARISEEAPLSTRQGHLIKKGFSTELDEYIHLSTHAQTMVADLEKNEKEKTGISSLKIRYNNVFGFYIEITNIHKDKAPAHYQRKQTLSNAERYCTEELIELEKKVLSAQTKRFELEYTLFEELKNSILSQSSHLLELAYECSQLDVFASLAWLSLEENYCRPQLTTDKTIQLQASRHPVVEQFARGHFIANNLTLLPDQCLLITGPNMAGKSTLMRQVALIVLMAQMGSYVPASAASLPLYDSIFTRIGASDQLSEGLSTFMVEMTETASMLKSATQNSLLILDEVGRGTATFDGMSLAQAILEYILVSLKSHVLFATHYHELTNLETSFSQILNAHMQVLDKNNGQIEFLHVLKPGPAGKSYGVQVAELAGLPETITQRAYDILQKLEHRSRQQILNETQSQQPTVFVSKTQHQQISLFEIQENSVKDVMVSELKKLQIQKITPLQALNKIAEWQEKLN